jgi:hypothetical protein
MGDFWMYIYYKTIKDLKNILKLLKNKYIKTIKEIIIYIL